MTRLEPFKPEDLALIDMLPDERELAYEAAEFLEVLAGQEPEGATCQTVWLHGKPWIIGGWWTAAPGVKQVFLLLSREAQAHPIWLVEHTRRWLQMVEALDCHRIQTYSLPTEKILDWMLRLGFACEGRLRRYTKAGQDYQIWSRVKVDGIWRGLTN